MLKRTLVGSAVAAMSWVAYQRVRRWWATWGVDPAESAVALPGDDLVSDAQAVDTRGITIDAPPLAVWPWLVQMGYGRAGWYSYDRLDMRGRSADEINPEWQSLAVGDMLPTDPKGGFVVKVLEPNRTLVALVDSEIAAAHWGTAPDAVPVREAPGLAASGRFLETAMPQQFAASWAFILEPVGDGRTRLIERVRLGAESGGRASTMLAPVLGFGVFVMMQRQMRGIAERAERAATEVAPDPSSVGSPAPVPAA